ncbi:MAG: DUF4184 family protein [Planctomycetota bacterium]|nr:DUF4184 family protein [Planctomycetota bacterium]
MLKSSILLGHDLVGTRMPFTVTHILAITPVAKLGREKLPLSALVIGSMVPDFPLFFPIGLRYQETHSILGILTVCLPVGLALYWIFHGIMAEALFELLSPKLRGKAARYLTKTVGNRLQKSFLVAICLCFGALTHVAWDAFTHAGQWGVELVPALSKTVLTIQGGEWRGFKVFQHGSSVIGLPILLGLMIRWICKMEIQVIAPSLIPDGLRRGLIFLFVVLPIVLGLLAAPVLASSRSPKPSVERLLFHFVTVDLSAFLSLLLLYSLSFNIYHRFIRRPAFESKEPE